MMRIRRSIQTMAVLLLPVSGQAVEFALGFEGLPETVTGWPGDEVTFEAYATLTTTNNPEPDGAQAWSISIEIGEGYLTDITVNGIIVDTIYDEDHDDNPATPPIYHDSYLQDLGAEEVFFKIARLGYYYDDPTRKGAVSAVVLRGMERMVLQPNGTQRIAKFTAKGKIPLEGCTSLYLKYEDGFKCDTS